MPKSNIKFIPIQNKSVIVHVCFVLFIVCLYICVCECLPENKNHKTKHKNNTTSKQHSYVRGPLRECRSILSGASGLPYYCAPAVCVSAVIDLLAVWRHNKPKTKNFDDRALELPCVWWHDSSESTWRPMKFTESGWRESRPGIW